VIPLRGSEICPATGGVATYRVPADVDGDGPQRLHAATNDGAPTMTEDTPALMVRDFVDAAVQRHRSAQWQPDSTARAVPECRAWFADVLADWSLECPDLALVGSELLTNAIKYGSPPITVWLADLGVGLVEVAVYDANPQLPIPLDTDTLTDHGWGLSYLVPQCSASWRAVGCGTRGKLVLAWLRIDE